MDKDFLSLLEIQKLEKKHPRSEFDCGVEALNIFLQKHARQNQSQGLSVTYVVLEPDNQEIVGYYTLSTSSVELAQLPEQSRKKLPDYPISFARIGRLASSLKFRGKGVGTFLLMNAFERILSISDEIGIHAVEVDAKDQEAKNFYLRFGFQELIDDPLHLYITIKTLRKAF